MQLSDRGLQEMSGSGNFMLPSFASVDPQGDTTISVSVPRTIARLQPGHDMVAPVVEELPAWRAEHVEIEVAYSGTAFYRDVRPKTGKRPRKMMIDWAEGHARHKLSLRGHEPGARE